MIIPFLILIPSAYLLGSLSSAIIVCKLAGLPDPRTTGSGNPGASNVLRLGSKKHAGLVLLGDMLKGTIIVALGRLIGLEGAMLGWLAVAVVLGHVYPVFFQFKGGKGVATALGAFLVLLPGLAIFAVLVWIGIVKLTRYSSLASLTATAAVVVLNLFIGDFSYQLPLLVLLALLFWRHRDNIQRLRAGTENKI